MSSKLVVKKGYTLEVVSWENDGDNYRTKSMTFDDKNLALSVLEMCKSIFVSNCNGEAGIGNMMDDEYKEAHGIVLDYMKEHPILCGGETDDDRIISIGMNYNYGLMGGSEYYASRVFESGVLYYSSKDVHLNIVAKCEVM